jgi:hypothetical protein
MAGSRDVNSDPPADAGPFRLPDNPTAPDLVAKIADERVEHLLDLGHALLSENEEHVRIVTARLSQWVLAPVSWTPSASPLRSSFTRRPSA